MKFDSSNTPSRMVAYPVKEINVLPFRPKQLPLISEAISINSMRPMIEAMQQVCDYDVFNLTLGDFFHILTWQRMQRKFPVEATWECEGVLYRRRDNGELLTEMQIAQMIEQWELAKDTEASTTMEDPNRIEFDSVACGDVNVRPLQFGDFDMLVLPDEVVLEPGIDFPRVKDLVEFTDMLSQPEHRKLAPTLLWIKGPESLLTKLHNIMDNDDDELFDRANNAMKYEHGIRQHLMLPCPRCGFEHPFSYSVNPASFLPR